MNYKNILKVSLAALASLAVLAGCAKKEFKEVTELSLKRCLEPQNLSARVDAATGDHVTFGWDVNKDADGYLLTVYTDEEMTEFEDSWNLEPDEVPAVIRLTADQNYWFTVQAYRVDGEGIPVESTVSNVAVYDGSIKTYAVKDNLFLEVTGRTETTVSLAWSNEVEDYEEVTELSAVPVKGGKTVKKDLSAAEKTAAAATVTGLEPATEYQITLFYMSASRGTKDVWTQAAQGTSVRISTAEELKTAVAGGDFYLAYSDAEYAMGTAAPAATLNLVGEMDPDGKRPLVTGSISLTNALAEGSTLHFENIHFFDTGTTGHLVTFTSGPVKLAKIEFVNCEISGFKSGLFYNNVDGGLTVGEVTFDSCEIHDILGSGGDGFDIRKATEITTVKFVNSTIWDGFRTFVRLDAVDAIKIGGFILENNTIKGVSVINDGNNQGLFGTKAATALTLKNNLFLWEDGGETAEGTDDKTQLVRDNSAVIVPTLTASNNYSYAHGKDFFKKVSAADAGCKVMNVDPCYNSKGNFFQLAAQDLIDGKVGASKWWISYVEKPEDLTQNVITEAHTWNLQDASLFAGEVKNSRVRDELLLVGTEAAPMNADGGINFLSATPLSRKGYPVEGYAAFKIDAPGSVDLLVADAAKTGASVVVALGDDNGIEVKGGVAASSAGVQKVLIPKVDGEGTIYLYANGAISLTKLAWSEDVKGGNSVLSTPKLTVAPVTVKEGEAAEVSVSWEAVEHAGSYELKFNKRLMELEEGALSYTVPAETIAALEAGLYNFTIQALPAANDIYYVKSEIGSAAIAIQPKGGEEVVEKSIVWDFTEEYVANLGVNDSNTYKYEAGSTELVASANATETLYFSPNGKDIKTAGKTSTADNIAYKPITFGGGAAYAFFKTAKAGKLKVVATQGKVAADGKDCKLGIKVNGVSMTDQDVDLEPYALDKPVLDAKTYEFTIDNATGEVQEIQIVKVGGSTSPWIYRIEFTYTESAAEAPVYKWNFTEEFVANLGVNDNNTYKYEAGTTELVTSADATETLYFSPNGKDIKTAGKTSTADNIAYKPITFGGGAAYAFFKTAKAGKLKVVATQGKVAADGKDCKLGIKVNGVSMTDQDVDLAPYALDKPVLDAQTYEFTVDAAGGAVQEIQIVKVSGSTSPWIYEIVFESK